MTISRLKPLTVKEIEKLAATPPNCIKHRYLGGVPGFVLVHTPAGYTGYGLIYRAGGGGRGRGELPRDQLPGVACDVSG